MRPRFDERHTHSRVRFQRLNKEDEAKDSVKLLLEKKKKEKKNSVCRELTS